ncbi:MAG TPA: hypothetical protein VIH89_02510 [Candidatus Sulfotelmatobacter sp.]
MSRFLDCRWAILDSPATRAGVSKSIIAKAFEMTYLEVVFRYGDAPGERAMQAIDGMREVYGVQRVKFNDSEHTVRVTYDASRLKQDAVVKMLRQAGVDVRETLILA